MEKGRAATFDENRPTVSEQELWEAAQRGSAVMSFNARPLPDENGHVKFLGVKLVLTDGTVKTVLFDPYSSCVFCEVIEALKKGQWMVHQSTPPGQTRQ
jgi:hypothetical protein